MIKSVCKCTGCTGWTRLDRILSRWKKYFYAKIGKAYLFVRLSVTRWQRVVTRDVLTTSGTMVGPWLVFSNYCASEILHWLKKFLNLEVQRPNGRKVSKKWRIWPLRKVVDCVDYAQDDRTWKMFFLTFIVKLVRVCGHLVYIYITCLNNCMSACFSFSFTKRELCRISAWHRHKRVRCLIHYWGNGLHHQS